MVWRPRTLDAVIERHLADGIDIMSYHLQRVLDAFYNAERQAMIDVEPQLTEEDRLDAYVAAAAEYLAREWALRVPPWVEHASRWIIEKTWYPWDGSAEIRAIWDEESPEAFRRRGIMTEAEPLRRASRAVALMRAGRWTGVDRPPMPV